MTTNLIKFTKQFSKTLDDTYSDVFAFSAAFSLSSCLKKSKFMRDSSGMKATKGVAGSVIFDYTSFIDSSDLVRLSMKVLRTIQFWESDEEIVTQQISSATIERSDIFDLTKIFLRSDEKSKSSEFGMTTIFDDSRSIDESIGDMKTMMILATRFMNGTETQANSKHFRSSKLFEVTIYEATESLKRSHEFEVLGANTRYLRRY
jgi:hypothetical protein